MLDSIIIQELRAIVGPENIATEKQDLICYATTPPRWSFFPLRWCIRPMRKKRQRSYGLPTAGGFGSFPAVPAVALPEVPCPRQAE